MRLARFMFVTVALVAVCWVGAQAQDAGQKPPDPQAKPEAQATDTQAKPAEAKAPELTAEQKAFNAIAEEKDAQKRVPMYEKFIADYPNSGILVSLARSEVQRATLATLKSSSAKYLELVNKEIDSAKANVTASQANVAASQTSLASTYARFAGEMLSAGVLLDQAEEFARQAVSLLDEEKYIAYQKDMDKRSAEAFARRAANPTPAAAAAPAGGAVGFSMRTVNGAPTVQPMAPRPAPAASTTPPRPPTPPRARTDDEVRSGFRSLRAGYMATLGRVLMKRDKTAEGESVLKEAFASNLPAGTKALVARELAASAKKAGNDANQVEYLTVLALSGQITADEQKEFEALYSRIHNGSLDGLDAMLDARYAKENPKFPVTPFNRNPTPGQRVVLGENFTGSG